MIGVGNAWRGDDAAGLEVVRRLRGRSTLSVTIVELSGEATELLDAWSAADWVVVIDAVTSGAPAGTLHRLDAADGPLPAHLFSHSTHGWGVAQAIELGRSLGRLPSRLTVWGIESRVFDAGRTLSPAVERAVDAVTEQLAAALAPRIGGPPRA